MRSSHIEVKDNPSKELKIAINPKGEIRNKTNTFFLILEIIIEDKTGNVKIETKIEGEFILERGQDKEFENFLYLNAPAILFPYVRAYVNTLTTLSGNPPIVLPTLNLSGLRENLKNNTKVID